MPIPKAAATRQATIEPISTGISISAGTGCTPEPASVWVALPRLAATAFQVKPLKQKIRQRIKRRRYRNAL
ncbi:hypothetical protein DESC_700007 [Desulfosarcina cetonica]|nr:hypothetical protein DESC_700007 [Desulfosarcina cetonica]